MYSINFTVNKVACTLVRAKYISQFQPPPLKNFCVRPWLQTFCYNNRKVRWKSPNKSLSEPDYAIEDSKILQNWPLSTTKQMKCLLQSTKTALNEKCEKAERLVMALDTHAQWRKLRNSYAVLHIWRKRNKQVPLSLKTEAGHCQKNDWHLPPRTAKSTSVQQRR